MSDARESKHTEEKAQLALSALRRVQEQLCNLIKDRFDDLPPDVMKLLMEQDQALGLPSLSVDEKIIHYGNLFIIIDACCRDEFGKMHPKESIERGSLKILMMLEIEHLKQFGSSAWIDFSNEFNGLNFHDDNIPKILNIFYQLKEAEVKPIIDNIHHFSMLYSYKYQPYDKFKEEFLEKLLSESITENTATSFCRFMLQDAFEKARDSFFPDNAAADEKISQGDKDKKNISYKENILEIIMEHMDNPDDLAKKIARMDYIDYMDHYISGDVSFGTGCAFPFYEDQVKSGTYLPAHYDHAPGLLSVLAIFEPNTAWKSKKTIWQKIVTDSIENGDDFGKARRLLERAEGLFSGIFNRDEAILLYGAHPEHPDEHCRGGILGDVLTKLLHSSINGNKNHEAQNNYIYFINYMLDKIKKFDTTDDLINALVIYDIDPFSSKTLNDTIYHLILKMFKQSDPDNVNHEKLKNHLKRIGILDDLERLEEAQISIDIHEIKDSHPVLKGFDKGQARIDIPEIEDSHPASMATKLATLKRLQKQLYNLIEKRCEVSPPDIMMLLMEKEKALGLPDISVDEKIIYYSNLFIIIEASTTHGRDYFHRFDYLEGSLMFENEYLKQFGRGSSIGCFWKEFYDVCDSFYIPNDVYRMFDKANIDELSKREMQIRIGNLHHPLFFSLIKKKGKFRDKFNEELIAEQLMENPATAFYRFIIQDAFEKVRGSFFPDNAAEDEKLSQDEKDQIKTRDKESILKMIMENMDNLDDLAKIIARKNYIDHVKDKNNNDVPPFYEDKIKSGVYFSSDYKNALYSLPVLAILEQNTAGKTIWQEIVTDSIKNGNDFKKAMKLLESSEGLLSNIFNRDEAILLYGAHPEHPDKDCRGGILGDVLTKLLDFNINNTNHSAQNNYIYFINYMLKKTKNFDTTDALMSALSIYCFDKDTATFGSDINNLILKMFKQSDPDNVDHEKLKDHLKRNGILDDAKCFDEVQTSQDMLEIKDSYSSPVDDEKVQTSQDILEIKDSHSSPVNDEKVQPSQDVLEIKNSHSSPLDDAKVQPSQDILKIKDSHPAPAAARALFEKPKRNSARPRHLWPKSGKGRRSGL